MPRNRDRWHECDRQEDPIARLDCRTSKLNDATHRLERDVQGVKRRVNAGLVMQAFAGLGGLAALLNALRGMGFL